MGNKVNPLIYRANIFNNWKSKWYTDNSFSSNVISDFYIRKRIDSFICDKFPYEIYIERLEELIIIVLITSKKISSSLELSSLIGKFEHKKCIVNNIVSSSLCNSAIAMFLKIKDIISNRKNYRTYIGKLFYNSNYSNILGIKIIISGRVNGVEIAKKDIFCIGNISFISLNRFYSYKNSHFNTKYGIIGVKIYISIL
ncbi:hypothetical protein [Candidatus Vidania fulgoroideorum]